MNKHNETSASHIKLSPLCLQVLLLGGVHAGDGDQVGGQGLHSAEIHVPSQPVELARFRGHHLGLRHHGHGGGQPGWLENLPSPAGPQDRLHHAW